MRRIRPSPERDIPHSTSVFFFCRGTWRTRMGLDLGDRISGVSWYRCRRHGHAASLSEVGTTAIHHLYTSSL